MATENAKHIFTREAGSNVTNKRFIVEVAGGKVNRASVQGQKVDGVVAMISYGATGTAIAAGDETPVAKSGTVIVESGAAVADGAIVMTDNVGRAITFPDDNAAEYSAGKVVNGSSASAAGEDLSIELFAQGQTAGTP